MVAVPREAQRLKGGEGNKAPVGIEPAVENTGFPVRGSCASGGSAGNGGPGKENSDVQGCPGGGGVDLSLIRQAMPLGDGVARAPIVGD